MESSFPSPQIHMTANNDEENESHVHEHKDLITTFPRETGWNKPHDFFQYQGFWYIEAFLRGIMSVQQHFLANSTDIILASAPKTGTTWLKALTFAIVTRKSFDDSTSPLLVKVPHDCIPFLEIDLAEEKRYTRDPEIPLIATHIPYTSLPNSIVQSGCKIVYIWRDPRDAFVSLWHFISRQIALIGGECIPLEEAFMMFCEGVSNCGPYWDHVLGYWKARLENPDKILFLKYEEMMKDTVFFVKKLAEFIGHPFSKNEEDNGELQKIVAMCSFEKLSKLEVNKNGKHRKETSMAIENRVFFRKAVVGDWSNYLTAEMGARLDSIMENKLKGFNLTIDS